MWAPSVVSLLVCALPLTVTGTLAPLPLPRNFKRQAPTPSTPSENTFASIEPSDELAWVPCYSDSLAAQLGQVECARLIAPLDYDDEGAGEAILAMTRLRSNSSSYGRGTSVFVNPGGPGGNSIDFLLSAGPLIPQYIGTNRDVIAVSPRAVGPTLPAAACYASAELRAVGEQAFDREQAGYTNASLNILDALAESLGINCNLTSGDVLPYTGTVNTARDINFVSEKLGEDKLAYFGVSYGSVLGAALAALFPEKIERMVLDGVLDSNDWWAIDNETPTPELYIGDTDAALESFFVTCFAAGEERCPIWSPDGPQGSVAIYEGVVEKIRRRPIAVPGFGIFEYPLFRSGVFSSLYAPSVAFPLLAFTIAELAKDEPSPLLAQVIARLVRQPPRELPLVDEAGLSNGFESLYTIWCADKPLRDVEVTEEGLVETFEKWRSVSDVGGEEVAFADIVCQRFLYSAEERITERFENIETAFPILFVNPTADPITPLRNAYTMSEAFSGSSVLVVNGTGHTSAGADPAYGCGRTYILPYFLNGTLPESGTVCQGEQDPFKQAEELLSQ